MVNVVDEKVNQVVESGKRVRETPGFELPLLLFAGFRTIIDRLHAELAEQGHPDVRPVYGFAMQAIGREGATASEIGRRLGVSKQAAGKTVDKLEQLGYVVRVDDPADARRKVVRLTGRGFDSLGRSAAIFEELREEWAGTLGIDRVRALEADLRAMAPSDGFRLDVAGWFGA
ncbi:MarR family winged helix-turn-helix transcriptional regulator [Amycolatopsis keratiniphila]|uniref:MarR family winged helix-turn-helix transcriptional regulator n=1 Tax=Amycolatopsis keratiniphila TaxID=129921 RepID=UPI00087D123D|nr:MarR family transcriptional regulator [Amycolatopsis keratiniphila]OLZ43894.1 MarR family transcriptional regulator [Amycolatopsis keratiniphila subsp. nogabecina]SDU71442.1 DNA-binding transcriptional regulator, MarR family [Amycolatopsis keratiniphila]